MTAFVPFDWQGIFLIDALLADEAWVIREWG
jgi:hypothetical protein